MDADLPVLELVLVLLRYEDIDKFSRNCLYNYSVIDVPMEREQHTKYKVFMDRGVSLHGKAHCCDHVASLVFASHLYELGEENIAWSIHLNMLCLCSNLCINRQLLLRNICDNPMEVLPGKRAWERRKHIWQPKYVMVYLRSFTRVAWAVPLSIPVCLSFNI